MSNKKFQNFFENTRVPPGDFGKIQEPLFVNQFRESTGSRRFLGPISAQDYESDVCLITKKFAIFHKGGPQCSKKVNVVPPCDVSKKNFENFYWTFPTQFLPLINFVTYTFARKNC